MIIGITGKKQHGKNSVGDTLAEHRFTVISFAETLKDLCHAIDPIIGITWDRRTLCGLRAAPQLIRPAATVDAIGWDIAKERYPEIRRFLQRTGTEGAQEHLSRCVWVDAWSAKVKALGPDANIAACDVRFVNEAAAIRTHGGLLWRVARPRRAAENCADGHRSETEMESLSVDAEFVNDGSLADLRHRVERALCQARHPAGSARHLLVAS